VCSYHLHDVRVTEFPQLQAAIAGGSLKGADFSVLFD